MVMAAKEIAQLRIGHADELDKEADNAIAQNKRAYKGALRRQLLLATHGVQDHKKDDAL